MLQFQFFVDAWKRLGLQVELQATNYNQFQEKVRRGAYQIFWWGWVADYPDPENFLFLLYGPMSRSRSNGPNTANFDDARYNALFLRMKARTNDPERLALVGEMKSILESERPWIELFHVEDYALYHSWLKPMKPPGLPFSTTKYYDLDPRKRERRRKQWNQPILWPAYILAAALGGLVLAAVVRGRREG
jgi:ABC-type oligopeptide transport system substrate-binding subunit